VCDDTEPERSHKPPEDGAPEAPSGRKAGAVSIVLMGPPGAGKGTQAAALERRTGLKHIASGDLFRSHMMRKTELGQQARAYVDRGELVADDIVINMVLQRATEPDCRNGVIFDGFPRTRDQAEALIEGLRAQGEELDAVVALTVPRDMLLKRIAGRQTCQVCQTPYNIFYTPPRLEAVCDLCGGDLYTRTDDNMQTARYRLDVYTRETFPLVEYFRGQGLLREVDAVGDVDSVIGLVTEAAGLPNRADDHPVPVD
jgi:adenylate kinase